MGYKVMLYVKEKEIIMVVDTAQIIVQFFPIIRHWN